MLDIQEYLHTYGLEALENEFFIKVCHHPNKNIAIFNYDQLNSPKYHPIVKQARGLVLEKDTWKIVAKSMDRFYNYSEYIEDIKNFDWSDFSVVEKVDGSLFLLYYYDGDWHCNTRGSFGDKCPNECGKTWRQIFEMAFNVKHFCYLDKSTTYVCELCSPYTKVVKYYPEPQLYLLACFKGERETDSYYIRQELNKGEYIFRSPQVYNFKTLEDIQNFIKETGEHDQTWEGVVVKDKNGLRLKIKSPKYLALSRIKGESGNLFHYRHLLPFILGGDTEELLVYFPETLPYIEKYSTILCNAFDSLNELYKEVRNIHSQKEFALSIIHHPLRSIAFLARQQNKDLKEVFLASEDILETYLRLHKDD